MMSSRVVISLFASSLAILAAVGAFVSVKAAEAPKTDADGRAPAQEQVPAPARDSAPAQSKFETTDAAVAAAILREQGSNCIVDPAALEDMKIKREEIQVKARQLSEREAELAARERALNEEMAKLQAIREEIGGLDAARKKENDEKVAKLVETMETMSAKAAAQMLGSVDDQLAVAAAGAMSTPKLAKILNVMEAGRSSRLAESLAGVVRAKRGTSQPLSASKGATETAASSNTGPGKRGDENDGKSQQQQQSSSPAREPSATEAGKR